MALRYELVSSTLRGMLDEAGRQAEADAARGRPRLAGQLDNLRLSLASAVGAAGGLADFCRPWIDEERAAPAPVPENHKGWRYERYTQYDSDPRPYWRVEYAEYPPHASGAYQGGDPDLHQFRNLEPVYTSSEAFAPENLPITDDMLRAFANATMPGAWDRAGEMDRESIREGLTKSLRAMLTATSVQPGAKPEERA